MGSCRCWQMPAKRQQTGGVRSDVEENRLVFALNANVEPVYRHVAPHLLVGNESPAPLGWDQRQDGIARVRCLVGKVEAGVDLPEHATRKNAEHDMRCLRLTVG